MEFLWPVMSSVGAPVGYVCVCGIRNVARRAAHKFCGWDSIPRLMVEVKSRAGRDVLSDSVACFPPGEANPVICNRGGGVSL